MKQKYLIFESFILLLNNNLKNTIKVINSDGIITKINNFYITRLIEIRSIFISVEEEAIFEMKLIPEKISKYIYNDIPTINANIIKQNNKRTIEYIYQTDNTFAFYQTINNNDNNSQIYQLNNTNFNLDNIINNKFENYMKISDITLLKPYNTYIFIKECKQQCIFMKHINKDLNFEYILVGSKIIYLYRDFEYKFKYSKELTKIKIKK